MIGWCCVLCYCRWFVPPPFCVSVSLASVLFVGAFVVESSGGVSGGSRSADETCALFVSAICLLPSLQRYFFSCRRLFIVGLGGGAGGRLSCVFLASAISLLCLKKCHCFIRLGGRKLFWLPSFLCHPPASRQYTSFLSDFDGARGFDGSMT